MRKNYVREYAPKLLCYLKINHDKPLTELRLARAIGLKENEMRYVLSSIRWEHPVVLVKAKTYMYTVKNKEVLKKEYERMERNIKVKCIKKNMIKRLLKSA